MRNSFAGDDRYENSDAGQQFYLFSRQDGEIDALYLLKGFQGTGLGRKLFETCADALWKEGFARLIVNCLEGNPSLGFYERMGGRAVGERSDTLRGHVICEKILRFELK